MLTLIRSLARNPLVGGIIIALLIAAFALWGINDIFRGTGTSAVIVGSEHVSVQDLNRSYERQLFQIQQENPRFTREQAEQVGLGESIVQRVIAEAAIDAKANELGLSISDATLFGALETIPAFQNPFTNRFDPQTYSAVLRENGYSGGLVERQFENDMTDEMRRAQFITAALGGVYAPDIFAEVRQAYASERRSLRALLIPPSLAGDVGSADDETLSAFITDNAQFFERPEQRRMTLVRIQSSDLLRDIDVDPQDLQDLYDFRLENGELGDPATRSITQWNAPSQQAAETAAARLLAGDAVTDVVSELGLGEEVALAEVQPFQIPDADIATLAFTMSSGAVQAVRGQLGWRVLRIDAAFDPVIPSFEDLETELRQELAGENADGLMLDRLGQFEEARAGGATLEAAAAQSGLYAERFDAFTTNGYSIEGEPVLALLQHSEILQAAFAAPMGFATDIANYGENGYFALRVDEVIEARLAELDEVRDQAELFWQTRETDNRLQAYVVQAQERLAAGATMDEIAAGLGGDVRVEAAILNRQETAGPFTAQLVAQAFRLPVGGVGAGRADDQSVRVVVQVEDILPQSGGVAPANVTDALSEEMSNDAIQVLTSALVNAYEVRADQRLIDQALGRTDATQ